MTAHLKVSDEVVESTVGSDVILLHLATGQYFALDEIGTLIWNHVKVGTALEALPDLLAQQFDAPPRQIEEDVRIFLSELFENRMLRTM